MSLIKLVDLKPLIDERGTLVAIDGSKSISFDIKRIYYLFGSSKNVSRGHHAHINLKQLVICISGSCKIILDDGTNREEYLMNSKIEGLLIEGLIWREMHEFSEDCILLVLASELFDESDYIRDYNEFIKEITYV